MYPLHLDKLIFDLNASRSVTVLCITHGRKAICLQHDRQCSNEELQYVTVEQTPVCQEGCS